MSFPNFYNPINMAEIFSNNPDSTLNIQLSTSYMDTIARMGMYNQSIYPSCYTDTFSQIDTFWSQLLDKIKDPKFNFNTTSLFGTPMTGLYAPEAPYAPQISAGQSSASNLSTDDQKLNAKNNRLLNLLKNALKCLDKDSEEYIDLEIEINNYTKLSEEENNSINDKENPKSKYEIYNEHLKTIYEKFDKEIIREAILEYGTIDNKNIKTLLTQTGYEDDDINLSVTSENITNIKSAINKANKSNSNVNNNEINKVKLGTIPVLEFVSAWNTLENTNVIAFMANKLNNINNNNAKEEYISSTIKPVVNAMIKEADKQYKNKNLDNETKEKIQSENSTLSHLISSIDDKNCQKEDLENLATAFETLYTLLRKAETESLKAKITEQYKFLEDDALFSDKYFTDAMEKDLVGEKPNNVNKPEKEKAENVPTAVPAQYKNIYLNNVTPEMLKKKTK